MKGRFALAGLAVIAVVVVAAVLTLVLRSSESPDTRPRAVIADQLSRTAPDQAFIDQATAMLEDAGYRVDYVPYEGVDVEFYRHLPQQHYDVVLLRVHAGLRPNILGVIDAHLFTSQPYSESKYVQEQLDDTLKKAAYDQRAVSRNEFYFAIPVTFVRDVMEGDFGGADVVLMGCDVFRSENLAQAFIDRGANSVIGWDELVTAAHTDAATLAWLDYFLHDHLSARNAATAAGAEVGPDPHSGAKLLSYPKADEAPSGR